MESKTGYPHPTVPEAQTLYPNIPPPANPPPYEQTQQQPPIATTVIQTVSVPLGPEPTSMSCPSCGKQMVTNVKYETTTKTHLFGLLCCLICWPCVWLPYTMDSCKDATHYCPYCESYLGAYKS